MNNQIPNSSSEASSRGIVLIVALLLLVMLTILGIASMSSVVMQERMASNVNLQTLAFEAASAGVPGALRFDDPDNWPEDACERGGGGWDPGPWWPGGDNLIELPLGNGDDNGLTVGYRQRVGCFEPAEVDIPIEWEDEVVPIQLLVLTQGRVMRGSEVLAQREVEVRIGRRGQGDCLITIGPLADGALGVPNSNKFRVEGEEGSCPIQFVDPDDAREFRAALTSADRLDHWQPRPPGVTSGNLNMPWSDALTLARVINTIKIGMRANDRWPALPQSYDSPHELYVHATNPFAACAGTLVAQASTSNSPTGGLTYIAGSLSVGGNKNSIGLMLIENQFVTSGNQQYTGDLIVLGGHFDGNGMGNRDNVGIIKLHNLQPTYWDGAPDNDRRNQVAYCTWDEPLGNWPACDSSELVELVPATEFRISGGGNATLSSADCDDLRARWADLNVCLDAMREMMDPNPDPAPPVPSESMTWFEFHREFHPSLNSTVPPLDIPDFGDEPELVAFELPRCGEFSATTPTITSWREYIDRERWN